MTQTDAGPEKQLPPMEGLARQFYEWCRQGELRFQRCPACKAWRHPPREMCPDCGSWEWEWVQSTGRGRVFSWTVATRALHPAFKEDVPYAAVVIEMDEGVRLVSRVVDCLPDELTVDTPVEVTFERVTEDVTLPYFRRRQRVNTGRSEHGPAADTALREKGPYRYYHAEPGRVPQRPHARYAERPGGDLRGPER